MYWYEAGDPLPQTDEEAMKWLEGYPEEAHSLYKLYRSEAFKLSVVEALKAKE